MSTSGRMSKITIAEQKIAKLERNMAKLEQKMIKARQELILAKTLARDEHHRMKEKSE